MRIRYDRPMHAITHVSARFLPALCPLSVALLCVAVSGVASAQKVEVSPGVDARMTWTDNAGVGRSGSSDWIAEVAPSIGISREGGRVNGRLNTRFRSINYFSDSSRSNSFLTLDGRGEVEAIEDFLFIEADASIRRDGLSLFDPRAGDEFAGRGRRAETRSFSLAPRVEFQLGSHAQGSVGYRSRWLDSGRSGLSAARLGQWNADLQNPTAFGRFGWGTNYVRTRTYYDDSELRDVTQDVGRFTLFYNHSPQLRFRGIVGRESNDFGAGRKDSGSITGAGFDWFPTPRTTISGTTENRIFGQGYDLSVSHRRPRSVWELSYGKDYSSSLQRFAGLGFAEGVDADFLEAIGATEDPDMLAALIDEGWVFPETFVSNAYFLDKRWRAAVTLIGARNRLTLSFLRSDRENVSDVSTLSGGDPFRSAARVRNNTTSLNLSHRLTGLSSLNFRLTHSRAQSSQGLRQESRRLLGSVGYTTRLGPRTVAGLTYRHLRVDGRGGAADLRENVITANIGVSF